MGHTYEDEIPIESSPESGTSSVPHARAREASLVSMRLCAFWAQLRVSRPRAGCRGSASQHPARAGAAVLRWKRPCTDEHMRRRIGTPGKKPNEYVFM